MHYNTYVFKLPKSSDTVFKKNDLSIICENMKTGGLSSALENFNVTIIALSNDESLDIGSSFSTWDTSCNGITTFNGYFDY